jgi:hypothetical protein
MPVTMPRVAPGQIITSESYNALAAQIEALDRRIDQLTLAVTSPVAPVTTPGTTPAKPPAPTKITDILPHLAIDVRFQGNEVELRGENFGATKAQTRVSVDGQVAEIKSASATTLKFIIPNGIGGRPGTKPLLVENLTAGTFDLTTIYVGWSP